MFEEIWIESNFFFPLWVVLCVVAYL